MPISEDELDGYSSMESQTHIHMQQGPGGMSKAEQRRSNKPVMEKRRRARINHCLNELKSLILDAMKKDPARHSKLEKADILEMTVKHLQSIQRQQMTLAVNADPTVVQRFQSGFSECAGEVQRYVGRLDGVEAGVRRRLVSHLASCVTSLQQLTPPQGSASPEDVNNNTAAARLSGLQLIPSRLPSGELALLLPNSQHLPFFPLVENQNQVSTTSEPPSNTRRHSAFTAVKPVRSPLPSPTSTTASEDSCDRPFLSPQEVTSTSEHSLADHSHRKPTESQGLLKLSSENDRPKDQLSRFDCGPSERFPPLNSVQTPLSVITSNESLRDSHRYFDIRPQIQTEFKDPLDFSVKKGTMSFPFPPPPFKRPYTEDHLSDKILMKCPEPPLKVSRNSSEIPIQTSYNSQKNVYQIQNHSPKAAPCLSETYQIQERKSLLEIQNQPSTSAAETSRDMWRPW